MEKKAKAEAKRSRRNKRKQEGDASNPPEPLNGEPQVPEESN